MNGYAIEIDQPRDLGIAFPNDPRYGWRIIDASGGVVAQGWITYADQAQAREEASRVLARLSPRRAG